METRQGTITSLSTGRIVGSGPLLLRQSQQHEHRAGWHVLVKRESFHSTNWQDRFEVHLDDGRSSEAFFSRVEDDRIVLRCVDEL